MDIVEKIGLRLCRQVKNAISETFASITVYAYLLQKNIDRIYFEIAR